VRQLIHRHIGVRAEGMILAAGIWCLIGAGIIAGESPARPGAWHMLLPPAVLVGMWVLPALVAVATAASEHRSPIGLGLLTVAPTLHLCSYLTAWIVELWPGPPPGDPGGWYRAAYYAALLAFVVLLSHIPATVRAPLSGRPR
jgi:hypothetical protein